MGMVLTFVLAVDEAKRIDRAVREDAESRLDRRGERVRVKTVRAIKRERIRGIREDVVRRCRAWLKDRMPGTLSASNEGLGPPTCALLSLAAGKPFATEDKYMALLDLQFPVLVETFVRHNFLFLCVPAWRISRGRPGGGVQRG